MKSTLFVCSIITALLLGGEVNALADDAEMKERFVHAYSFYQEGQYLLAFAELEQFLKMYPNSEFADEATFLQGESLFAQNQLAAAAEKYEYLIRTYKDDRLFDDAYFRLGDTYYHLGEYKKARAAFEKLTTDCPKSRWRVDGYYWLAETLYSLKDYAASISAYQKVIQLDANYPSVDFAYYSLACAMFELGKYNDALSQLERLLKDYPNTVLIGYAHIKESEAYSELGKYQEAKKHFELASTLSTDNAVMADARYGIGESLYHLEQFPQGVEALSTFIQTYPKSRHIPQAYDRLAFCYLKVKNYSAAKAAYAKAVETSLPNTTQAGQPSGDTFYYMLAQALENDGKMKEAIVEYSVLLEKFPQSKLGDDARYRLGLWYYQQKEYRTAETFLKAVLAQSGEATLGARALLVLGNIAYAQERYADAIEKYQQFVNQYPQDSALAQAYFWLGMARFQAQQFSESYAALTKALSIGGLPESTTAKAHYRMGESQYQMGNYQGAITSFQQVTGKPFAGQEKSELAYAHFWTGESLYYLKQFAPAIEAFKKSLAHQPPQELLSGVYYRMGCAYEELGQRAEADAAFQRSDATGSNASSLSDASTATFRLAQSLQRQGKYTQAIAKYQSFLESSPNHPLRDETNYHLGKSFYELRQYPQAAQAFASVKKGTFVEAAYIGLGNAYYNQKKYPDAIKAYQQLISSYPKSPLLAEAHFWSGWAYFQQGTYDAGYTAFERVLSLGSTGNFQDKAQYQMAEIRYRQQNYNAALENYQKVLQRYGNDGSASAAGALPSLPSELADDAQYRIGDCYFALGTYDKAAASYQAALKKYPQSPYAQSGAYYMGVAHQELGAYQAAVDAYKQVTLAQAGRKQRDPFAEDAQFRLGDLYFIQKNYAGAAAELEKGALEYPKSKFRAKAQYTTGEAYYELGRYSDAIAAYQKVILEFPTSEFAKNARYEIGLAYHQRGDIPGAIKACEAFLTAHPTDKWAPEVQHRIGEYYFSQENFDTAIAAYRKALSLNPRSDVADDAQYAIGLALVKKGEYAKAIPEFDKLMEQFTSSEWLDDAQFEKGVCYLSQKQYAEAISAFSQVALKFPQSPTLSDALYHIGLSEEGLGEPQKALGAYQKLIQTYPQSEQKVNAYFRMGDIHHKEKRYKEAAPAFESVLPFRGELIPEAEFKLADCYFQQDDYAKAEGHYQQVVSRGAKAEWVKEAQARLSWIKEHPKP